MKNQKVVFKKGQEVNHNEYGKGTYSHRYAEDAIIVNFEKETDGHSTRVVRDETVIRIL